jgi:hypothetical protein
MGGMMLTEITPDVIVEYQNIRLKEGALGSTINAEVMFALRIMDEIGDAVPPAAEARRKAHASKDSKPWEGSHTRGRDSIARCCAGSRSNRR